jgi:WhiB family transcriptional regulator, redox-sensing transcriptional regulator
MTDWRHKAVCRDEEDPELWFPIGTSGPALLQVEQAKAVCRRCSVSDECLRWALESGQDFGVWGGMSEQERRALKRRGFRPRVLPVTEPAEDAPVPVKQYRCYDCHLEFEPQMPFQRLCLGCGAKHPHSAVRRRYVAVAAHA